VADEDETGEEDRLSDAAKKRVRSVFERGYKSMKEQDLKEERVALLRAWESFEKAQGSPGDLETVQKQMPSKVKKRRRLDDDTYEEYMDWVFPADNESEKKLSNLLLAAQKWKQAQEQQNGGA
jgi:crooked neck